MRMMGGFAPIQDGRHAGVAVLEQRRPMVARPGGEQRRQPRAQGRPLGRIAIVGIHGRVQAQPFDQQVMKAPFDAGHGQKAPVDAGIGGVEIGAAVQQVALAPVGPAAAGAKAPEHRSQQARPVHHGGVDDLARRPATHRQQGGQHAERQQHAAAEIRHVVQRHRRRTVGRPDGVQRPGQAQVVQIMSGLAGQRSLLAPARHAPVHQPRLAPQAFLGRQAHALHHAGPETFDQPIGGADQLQQQIAGAGRAQIQRQRAAAARQHVEAAVQQGEVPLPVRRMDAHHVGPVIGQHHGRERRRPQSHHFDDAQTL
ncbi:Uncharacterised protein [Bordetella pertussis]|nr:Uncharacterised protein [Bordetella pertussis]CFE03636.1 Uncharacterised protein [Bordetella pertussis]CFL81669.1 Uncharacterised protein [Bordetella pertussis]CFL91121.1 Uncharacterised protein [Bordetella pertussis]CFL96942.1 Uncharacterised protein [Bordetella pertussis]